jgi:hypothetical protein
MWTVIKFDKKKYYLLLRELKDKLGGDCVIYRPKILIQKYKKNKLRDTDVDFLEGYFFCFHNNFRNKNFLNVAKSCIGLKDILNGFEQLQLDIKNFIKKCKKSENSKGYVSQNFFEIILNSKYKFLSGPFSDKIFEIVKLQKNKINILIGTTNTTINNKQYLFNPI